MQNRYVGDVGDFGKYGLLRTLCGPATPTPAPGISLGVVWYLFPDENGNNDGQRTQYLTPASKNRAHFRACDPELYDCLAELVHSGRRSVEAVREAAILPDGTVFYEVPLSYTASTGAQRPGARMQLRSVWLQGALEATNGCDLVFLDPDNGLKSGTGPYAKLGPKYVYLEDVAQFARQARGLIIYHHSGRQGTVVEQVSRRFEQLRGAIPPGWSVCALQYHRGTSRVYFVLSSPTLHSQLQHRISSFLTTFWSRHFDRV